MSNSIEPTYLRYIYNGLNKGSIHLDNASALPEGLIGLYEEAFEENIPATERQKLLQRFTIWALLKKEVSANFVAELLDENEEDILNFIATYSKWFNSPESGKFQLYHERLKVFLLQKLSEKEVQALHENFITPLQKAIEDKKKDEFEYYALQYLSHHLLVKAFANNNGEKLLNFVQDKNIWDRQIELSNAFKWSQEGIRNGISFGVKDQDESVIDSGLGLVSLYNLEQNDIFTIVKLVTDNQVDFALERIVDFGGIEEVQEQRQFVLYMICLMELLLFSRVDKNHRKEALAKLIEHFGNNKRMNDVYWVDLISENLILKFATELKNLDLQFPDNFDLSMFYLEIFENCDCIKANDQEQIEALSWLINNIRDREQGEFISLQYLNFLLNNNLFLEVKSLKISLNALEDFTINLLHIKKVLDKGDYTLARREFELLDFESVKIDFTDLDLRIAKFNKHHVLSMFVVYCKMFQKEQTFKRFNKYFFQEVDKIENQRFKDEILTDQALFYLENKLTDESFNLISRIKSEVLICKIYSQISSFLKTSGKYYEYALIRIQIDDLINRIEDGFDKDKSISYLIKQLLIQGYFNNAFEKIKEIKNIDIKNEVIEFGAIHHAKIHGNKSSVFPFLSTFIKEFTDDFRKNNALIHICLDWSEQGFFEDANKLAKGIKGEDNKTKILYKINFLEVLFNKSTDFDFTQKFTQFSKDIQADFLHKGLNQFVQNFLMDSISLEKTKSNNDKNRYISTVAIAFSEKSDFAKSLFLIEEFLHDYLNENKYNDNYFQKQFFYFGTEKSYEIAVNYILKYNYNGQACRRLTYISDVLDFNGFKKEALIVLDLTFNTALTITDNVEKSETLIALSSKFFEKNMTLEYSKTKKYAIEIAHADLGLLSSKIFGSICVQLVFQGFDDESNSLEKNIYTSDKASINKMERALKNIEIRKQALEDVFFKEVDDVFIVDLTNQLIRRTEFNWLTIITFNKVFDFLLRSDIEIRISQYIELISLNNKNEFATFRAFAFSKYLKMDYSKDFLWKNFSIIDEDDEANLLQYFTKSITKIEDFNSYITNFIFLLKNDLRTLVHILNTYALSCIFFQENYPQEKIDKFNKILNIQWATDIKNQLPN